MDKIEQLTPKAEQKHDVEQYTAALNLLIFEGQMLWQIMGAFMLVHAILIAFIAQVAIKGDYPQWHLAGFFLSTIGFLLTLPWWGTFQRNSAYYHFRMAQAREAEPLSWKLLRERGQNFAEGYPVIIQGKMYKIQGMTSFFENKKAGKYIIILFGIIYLFLFIYLGPWWLCR